MVGLYYLQVRKSSTFVQGGNVRPFHDYLVNTNRVVNLWQQGKVTSETCAPFAAPMQEERHAAAFEV